MGKKLKTQNAFLPSNKKTTNSHIANKVEVHSEMYSGPLPSPQVLEFYNQAVPDAADRIIAMAERQASHRQKLEELVVKSGTINSLLGLIFGLIIGLATEIGAVYCIVNGYQGGGTTLGLSGLAGLVGVFVYGSKQRRQEREIKMGQSAKISTEAC